MLVLCLAATALALPPKQSGEPPPAPVLDAAEFAPVAATLPPGDVVLHPLWLPSLFGATERMQANTVFLAWIQGPNLAVKVGLLDDVLAIEPAVAGNWRFDVLSTSLTARWSQALGPHLLNVNLGGSVGRAPALNAEGVPIAGVYEPRYGVLWNVNSQLVINAAQRVRVGVAGDLLRMILDEVALTVSASWSIAASKRFRISLGAVLWVNNSPLGDLLAPAGDALPDFLYSRTMGIPTVEIWWRF